MKKREAKELIKVGRALLRSGLVIGTWGNVSVRVLEGFLITPSGIEYSALRPKDLVFVNLKGEKKEGNRRPSTEILLHAAIYRARCDVKGIVHTHSPYACVFAVNRKEIPPLLEEVAQLIGGNVRVATYALPGTSELADSAVSALGEQNAVLLANHGLVGVGRSLWEAFLICQVIEKVASVYLWAQLSGEPYILSKEEVKKLRESFLKSYGQQPGKED